GIEVKHGGMTNAMLHRSRMLVRESGRPVTIVTYKYDPDLRRIESTLREQGKLLDQMLIVNLWEDLCSWDEEKLATFRDVAKDTSGRYFDPLPVPEGTPPPAYAEKLREDGTFLQTRLPACRRHTGGVAPAVLPDRDHRCRRHAVRSQR
ncbi:MAG TPA: hypothetical protein VNZ66_02930, partial [Aeromicrobium sp.]|nr:hypothetical protein [Aeromicrobium sp.]